MTRKKIKGYTDWYRKMKLKTSVFTNNFVFVSIDNKVKTSKVTEFEVRVRQRMSKINMNKTGKTLKKNQTIS